MGPGPPGGARPRAVFRRTRPFVMKTGGGGQFGPGGPGFGWHLTRCGDKGGFSLDFAALLRNMPAHDYLGLPGRDRSDVGSHPAQNDAPRLYDLGDPATGAIQPRPDYIFRRQAPAICQGGVGDPYVGWAGACQYLDEGNLRTSAGGVQSCPEKKGMSELCRII